MSDAQLTILLTFIGGQIATIGALARSYLELRKQLADNAARGLAQREDLKLLVEAVLEERGISPAQVRRDNGSTEFVDAHHERSAITPPYA